MVSERLLAIIVCPETRQPLRLADASLVEELNRRIETGSLKSRGGEAVAERLDEGLIREDGAFLYPVRDGTPVLLVDEAIPLGR